MPLVERGDQKCHPALLFCAWLPRQPCPFPDDAGKKLLGINRHAGEDRRIGTRIVVRPCDCHCWLTAPPPRKIHVNILASRPARERPRFTSEARPVSGRPNLWGHTAAVRRS